MQPRRLVQALVLAAVLAVGGFAIVAATDGWGSWVFLGFLVIGVLGTAIATDDSSRGRRGRTFIRHYDDSE